MPNAGLEGALRRLLQAGEMKTQEEMVAQLQAQGWPANQSKVSRLLRKWRVVKVMDATGKLVYQLGHEQVPPPAQAPLTHLVTQIVANESLIVVHTSPGSASLVARLIDFQRQSEWVLGTLAGDDTLLVIPKHHALIEQIVVWLQGHVARWP